MRIAFFMKAAVFLCLLSTGVQAKAGPLPLPAREGAVGSAEGSQPDGNQKEPDQGIREERKIMVHYMPWYSSKPFSAQWGWHWTMNHFNPDKVTRGGGRELASHYQPLIGPYDSNDPDTLECQVLLMKFAGIDGVIIDWYGINDFNDYAAIHRNTGHLIRYIRKAGLKFAICYEDQTVANMIKGEAIKKGEDVLYGKKTLQWLQENWFTDDAYLRVGQRPLMLVFGPMHFIGEQWHGITAGLHPLPLLYCLPHLWQKANADGIFGWPPVHGGKRIAPEVWRKYLRELYTRGREGERVIAPVFPGFHDIYSQAGVHESYGFLDDGGGATFSETLDLAWQSGSKLIQVATWNDYGEGTIIEPTTTFGYRYLEVLQKRVGGNRGEAFTFTADHLRLAVKLYQLRKRNKGERQVVEMLDKVSSLLFSSRCAEAAILLNEAGRHTLKIDDKLKEPFK